MDGHAPVWVYDFNRHMYFFYDHRTQERIYQNDPKLANQQQDRPRYVPYHAQQTSVEPDPAFFSSTGQGTYHARPQPSHQSPVQATSNRPEPVPTANAALQGSYDNSSAIANLTTSTRDLSVSKSPMYAQHTNQPQTQHAGIPTLLRSDIKRTQRPKKFFVEGKVFLTLWTEGTQADRESCMSGQAWSRNSYNEWVYSKVRRFVVVREDAKSCTAVPITTNDGHGVAKDGEKKSNYCIVYSGKIIPPLGPREAPSQPGEAPMQPYAIQIDTDNGEKLDPMSRIDLAKPQTIQHYYKVKSIGKVNRNSAVNLKYQFKLVFDGGVASQSATPRSTVPTDQSVTRLVRPVQRSKSEIVYEALLKHGYTQEQAHKYLNRYRKKAQMTSVSQPNAESIDDTKEGDTEQPESSSASNDESDNTKEDTNSA